MDQFYLLEMPENAWVIGGKVTSQLQGQLRRISSRHIVHFSTVAVLIGVYQSDISPLLSIEVIESCVMLVLLYGSENWILVHVDALIRCLEAFQAELVKRVLKWPKYHSNTAVVAVLDVPTMKCRVLEWKLDFLKRVMADDTV